MAQLLDDDDADTSDASSLYDEIDPSALAQLAAGNASARTQFLALLDKCAAAERDAAAAQDAIAAMAESVAEIGCQTPQWGGDRAAMRQGAIERRIPYSILNQNSRCNEAKSVAGKIRLLLQV